jgi:hypothetical protein
MGSRAAGTGAADAVPADVAWPVAAVLLAVLAGGTHTRPLQLWQKAYCPAVCWSTDMFELQRGQVNVRGMWSFPGR